MRPLNLTLLQHLARLSTRSNNNKWLNIYYTPLSSCPSHSCQLRVIRHNHHGRGGNKTPYKASSTRHTAAGRTRVHPHSGSRKQRGRFKRKQSLMMTFQLTGPHPRRHPHPKAKSVVSNSPCLGTAIITSHYSQHQHPTPNDSLTHSHPLHDDDDDDDDDNNRHGKSQCEPKPLNCPLCAFFTRLWIEDLEKKIPALVINPHQKDDCYHHHHREATEIAERAGKIQDERANWRDREHLQSMVVEKEKEEEPWGTVLDCRDLFYSGEDEHAVEVVELQPLSEDEGEGRGEEDGQER